MATTYLDSLSPGMRARLYPNSRTVAQQKAVFVFKVNGTKVDSRQSRNSNPPLTRPGARKKVSGF